MDNDNVKYENYWVAYFDILGFRNLVETSHLSSIRREYIQVVQALKRNRWAADSTWFSDTFVLYARNDSESSFRNINCASQLLFREMFRRWIPLRGCLNVGEFYVDKEQSMFIGPALVEAYDLAEKQNWIGFVLSQKVKAMLEEHDTANGNFKQCYCEYDVPCKSAKKCNLSAYNLKLRSKRPFKPEEKEQEAKDLWNSLIWMEKHAKRFPVDYNESVIAKYENTKNFLFEVFPLLKQNIIDRNSHFPRKSG